MIIDLRENLNIFCSVVIYPVVNKGVFDAPIDTNFYALV